MCLCVCLCVCLSVCLWVFTPIISKSSWPVLTKFCRMIDIDEKQVPFEDEMNSFGRIQTSSIWIFIWLSLQTWLRHFLTESDLCFQWEQKVETGKEDFQKICKNIKKEMVRFEKLRINDFKNNVIKYLEVLMDNQEKVEHFFLYSFISCSCISLFRLFMN